MRFNPNRLNAFEWPELLKSFLIEIMFISADVLIVCYSYSDEF